MSSDRKEVAYHSHGISPLNWASATVLLTSAVPPCTQWRQSKFILRERNFIWRQIDIDSLTFHAAHVPMYLLAKACPLPLVSSAAYNGQLLQLLRALPSGPIVALILVLWQYSIPTLLSLSLMLTRTLSSCMCG